MRASNEAISDLMGYRLFMLSRWALMAALMASGTSSRMSTMSSALLLSSAHAHNRLSAVPELQRQMSATHIIELETETHKIENRCICCWHGTNCDE